MLLGSKGEDGELCLHLLIFQLLSAQNNPYAEVAHFGGAYPDHLQGTYKYLSEEQPLKK